MYFVAKIIKFQYSCTRPSQAYPGVHKRTQHSGNGPNLSGFRDFKQLVLRAQTGMRLILETTFSIELAFGTIFVKMKKAQNPQILASYYTAENSKLISAFFKIPRAEKPVRETF